MKVENNKFVSLSYTLTVDGAVADKADATRPLSFVFGTGMLLPKFEDNIKDKNIGDTFKFTLSAEEGYGERIEDAVVELPKDIFLVDGVFNDELVVVGSILPMMDADGNRMPGTVMSINDNTVTMDFNHPMADKVLNFEGEILAVREATEADMMPMGGGCSNCEGGDCDCDSESCDSEGGCSCGCNS